MWNSTRNILSFIFVSASFLLACGNGKTDPNGNNYGNGPGVSKCAGQGCECIGSDCVCTDTGCICTGSDCVCTGNGCDNEMDRAFVGRKTPKEELLKGGADTDGVLVDADGNIRPLRVDEKWNYMWLANTDEGYVSKYDTNTGREVARYLVVFPRHCTDDRPAKECQLGDNGLVAATGPVGEGGLRGLQPSRTAIDYRGDAWVGNRAILQCEVERDAGGAPILGADGKPRNKHYDPNITKRASVTKIAHATTPQEALERCRNNGSRTSRDINGNGIIDNDEWYHPGHPDWKGWMDPDSYDDCVLFTRAVCNPLKALESCPLRDDYVNPNFTDDPKEVAGVRALAVAPGKSSEGDAWAGCWTDKTLVHVHGDSGRVLNTVPLDIRPYGAIADEHKRVWAVQKELDIVYRGFSRRTNFFALQAVNTATNPPAALAKVSPNPAKDPDAVRWCSAYGIGLDAVGRIWLAGRFTEGVSVCRYDPQKQEWWQWGVTPQGSDFGSVRGIAVAPNGWVYVSGNGVRSHDASDWAKTRSQLMVFDSTDYNRIIPIQISRVGNDPSTRFSAYDATSATGETGAVGVGLDVNNNAWMVNHTGTAIRFAPNDADDPQEKFVRLIVNTRHVPEPAVPGGIRPVPKEGLYTYSDFTGYQLRNYVPKGYIRFYFKPCPDEQTPSWQGIEWTGSTPPPSEIRVEVRYGNEAEVKSQTGIRRDYADPAPGTDGKREIPLDGGEPRDKPSPWISLTFYLDSKGGSALPVLRDFGVYVQCLSGLQ